uniref:Uncharacterized protein n=1 Tax=Nelumbo nucifera TaxID=4432 RepID=A0A822YG93_NELNU|nr:TPA_asm: hypothetical protein HUJ06_009362 [Nelumbo nucifera]
MEKDEAQNLCYDASLHADPPTFFGQTSRFMKHDKGVSLPVQRVTSVAPSEATTKGGESVVNFGVAGGESFGGGIESIGDRGVQSGHEQAVMGTLMANNIEDELLGKFKDPEGISKMFLYNSKLGAVGPSKKRKVVSFFDVGNELIHHLWVGENGGKETCEKVPDHRSDEVARGGCTECSNSWASVVVSLQPRVDP